MFPFDFEVTHVPGVTLGIVDYLSRYPTFPAAEPSKYDELFVVKSIEAFHKALFFINSYNVSLVKDQNCMPPREGLQFVSRHNEASYLRHSPFEGDNSVTQCFNQSYRSMQMDFLRYLLKEGVDLCSHEVNQSETGMQTDYCRPVGVSKIHCLRPESLQNSHLNSSSLFLTQNFFNMTQPLDTTQTTPGPTTFDLNATITQPDPSMILNSTAEQADLLTFVESFPISSPNFRRPSPRPPIRSRQLNRISRLDQIRQRNRAREWATKTRFVATRTTISKDGHTQLLEAMRRCRLSKPGKVNMDANIRVLAVSGGKPLLFSSKKEIVGLPGLLDADLLTELTEEDRFLGPMKRAIINKDITSFNKLGSYMAQFWPKATV